MTEGASDVLMFAMLESALGQPAKWNFGFNNFYRITVAAYFVAVGATVKRNDSAARLESTVSPEKDAIFQRSAGELPFLDALHLRVNEFAQSAAFGDAAIFLSVLLVLLRKAAEKSFDEFDVAVRQRQVRAIRIELK